MSTKELKFRNDITEILEVEIVDGQIKIELYNEWSDRTNSFKLDRNQADLLRLYLEEYLKHGR